MLSHPSTEQILLDCRQELLDTILPAITAEPARIAVQMMENVLRNCAARAAHEIAWMRDEEVAMVAYAERVVESGIASGAVSGVASGAGSDPVTVALAAYRERRSDSLHLTDTAATYSLSGHCLSAALEAAMAADDDALHLDGRAILEARLAHENEIMGEWAFVGRA